jgi:uncharacterized protein YutE (UPF0331/DUF86 family)
MSPIDAEIVKRKLSLIVRNLEALKSIAAITEEEYGKDIYRRKATERLLQELIEAAIDINTHIIVELGGMVPDSYYESFPELAALEVLPADFAKDLAPSAGLRNRLVHEYDAIDDSIVHRAARRAISLYTRYVETILNFITDKTKG